MNVFDIHRKVVGDYARYIQSFINISDPEIEKTVKDTLSKGKLWPQALLQFNPAHDQAGPIEDHVRSEMLHKDTQHIFKGYSLYRHQYEAMKLGVDGTDFIVTSGTGSGKSLTYMGTIFNHLLSCPEAQGVTAVIVYPMNALINSQTNELNTYKENYKKGMKRSFPISYAQYTGQEKQERRQKIRKNPPQILLTNYMMLELLLTRTQECQIRDAIFANLRFLVFDELHTYRGRQGADISMLIRRIKAQSKGPVCCIGTSATMVSAESAMVEKEEVVRVASTIFGRDFGENQIINETLVRSLDDSDSPPSKEDLYRAVMEKPIDPNAGENKLRSHPVAVWLERCVALQEQNGRLARRLPVGFGDVVKELAEASSATEEKCREALEMTLRWISSVNRHIQEKGSRYTLLPFKLHQFFSQTGSVYTTLDQGDERFITLEPGLYRNDEEKKPIFTNVFSRITGHAFICVSLADGRLLPREFKLAGDEDDAENGYLIVDPAVWDPVKDIGFLPDSWVKSPKNGQRAPTTRWAPYFPRKIYFDEYGNYSETEPKKYCGWFMRAPLLFDPTGGVPYGRKINEGGKLTRLGNEGRSTSTTITAFSILSRLRDEGHALRDQKILSFTDSRQDAALQAGHFNDFAQVILLRTGIYKALETENTDSDGILDYTTLGDKIFSCLSLPLGDYANRDTEPELAPIKKKYEETFKTYLFIRALADLRRSWRIVLPNLEQCALLNIDYRDLEEIAASDGFWADLAFVNGLAPVERHEFLRTVLDYFRLEYAIYSENYLTPERLKEFERQFREQLRPPWTLDVGEELNIPSVIRLDPLHRGARLPNKSMGPASSLGKFIKHAAKSAGVGSNNMRGEGYQEFILHLMRKLKEADYLYEESAKSANNKEVPVFRLRIDKILWKLGDGKTVRPDLVRRPSYKERDITPNVFFRDLYRDDFIRSRRLTAADHTGQVSVSDRQDREERFRADWYLDEAGKHPNEDKMRREAIGALFCSPTMELGVDIGGLSVVHMRNVPPNAANYIQRSGRAGRNGEGALIFTYCSGFSAHDRHYFQHQAELVAGKVQAPRIDLCNEELLLTHLNALAISNIGLPGLESEEGSSPSLMRLVVESDPAMPLSPSVVESLKIGPAQMASIKTVFENAIADFSDKLKEKPGTWYSDAWIDQNLKSLELHLDGSLERWRKMYQSARAVLTRATRSIESGLLKVGSDEYRKNKRLQDQATRQLNLLRNDHARYSDLNEFYPYRYLAAEGFLPGYNFTRLPLRIFVSSGGTVGEYISRPRLIALREFGPRNVIYHNGNKYRVTQLVVQDAESSLSEAKLSKRAGYFLKGEQADLEICPFSGLNLSDNANKEHLHDLLEMAESRTEETARITCEEEERISSGYRIEQYFHVDGGNFSSVRKAVARSGDTHFLNLRFIPAARLIHLNKGWRSRKEEGFPIGMISGNWLSALPDPGTDVKEEHRIVKLWTSNLSDALYVEPMQALGLSPDGVITLQYAFKRAIESVFQVESVEIGVSSAGDSDCPNMLLYEASEGSLGILSQFVDDKKIFPKVVDTAEQICRFEDENYKAPASYDDLMSYYNQRDHLKLDRFLIQDALGKLKLAEIEITTNPDFADYEEQYQHMLQNLDPNSSTEHTFIEYLYENGLRLPDAAQKRVPGIYCQPDFYYEPRIWVFCDGSHHDNTEVRQRDSNQRQLIMARGDEIWSWHYREDLAAKIRQRPDIFKKVR